MSEISLTRQQRPSAAHADRMQGPSALPRRDVGRNLASHVHVRSTRNRLETSEDERSDQQGHAAGVVLGAAPAWDFSRVPVFSADRPGRGSWQLPPPLRSSVSVGGRAVADAIREASMENRATAPPSRAAFSAAATRVRMRDDASAERSAHLLGAHAVAFGSQILFRRGRYAPNTEAGRALIAHELTHVAHQIQTGRSYPQRLIAGDVLSVQFTQAMAEDITASELDQQIELLRAHLLGQQGDLGATENLKILEAVARARQGTAQPASTPAAPAPSGQVQQATLPPTPTSQATAPGQQKSGEEEQHGKFWWWLHSHGLTTTKHERAELLRWSYGPKGGVVVTDKDGDPVDVDRLSDDEVIALNQRLRGRPIGPPLPIAAAALSWPLACDATGKVHGPLPDTAQAQQKIQSLTREELEQSAEELEKSIAARKAEQLRLGEEGVHRARIAEEEDLLRAIRKKLSGS